jgi:hypothetical protein
MRIPKIKGTIKRRLLVNYRAAPDAVQKLLPSPFKPKLHRGYAIVGICLIRLENIRPVGFPSFFGISSENAAHRIAVEWLDSEGLYREGVYIPRRDSSSIINQLTGGRLFPGVHQASTFEVKDSVNMIDLSMSSIDQSVKVRVVGCDAESLPSSSCFKSLQEASDFFQPGSLGFSKSRDPNKSNALILHTYQWKVRALSVSEVHSSWFEDSKKFPKGSLQFDHALIMRDISHEWHSAPDMKHSSLEN